jgi:uncharacterized protein YcgI (DUF1989 family)
MVTSKFGKRTYQEFSNDFHRNARDNFLIELSKHGMGLADIVANVNFFSKAVVDDEGHIEFVPDHCLAGASIGLRTEMDILLVLANCPHPLAPIGEYPRARVEIAIFLVRPARQ